MKNIFQTIFFCLFALSLNAQTDGGQITIDGILYEYITKGGSQVLDRVETASNTSSDEGSITQSSTTQTEDQVQSLGNNRQTFNNAGWFQINGEDPNGESFTFFNVNPLAQNITATVSDELNGDAGKVRIDKTKAALIAETDSGNDTEIGVRKGLVADSSTAYLETEELKAGTLDPTGKLLGAINSRGDIDYVELCDYYQEFPTFDSLITTVGTEYFTTADCECEYEITYTAENIVGQVGIGVGSAWNGGIGGTEYDIFVPTVPQRLTAAQPTLTVRAVFPANTPVFMYRWNGGGSSHSSMRVKLTPLCQKIGIQKPQIKTIDCYVVPAKDSPMYTLNGQNVELDFPDVGIVGAIEPNGGSGMSLTTIDGSLFGFDAGHGAVSNLGTAGTDSNVPVGILFYKLDNATGNTIPMTGGFYVQGAIQGEEILISGTEAPVILSGATLANYTSGSYNFILLPNGNGEDVHFYVPMNNLLSVHFERDALVVGFYDRDAIGSEITVNTFVDDSQVAYKEGVEFDLTTVDTSSLSKCNEQRTDEEIQEIVSSNVGGALFTISPNRTIALGGEVEFETEFFNDIGVTRNGTEYSLPIGGVYKITVAVNWQNVGSNPTDYKSLDIANSAGTNLGGRSTSNSTEYTATSSNPTSMAYVSTIGMTVPFVIKVRNSAGSASGDILGFATSFLDIQRLK